MSLANLPAFFDDLKLMDRWMCWKNIPVDGGRLSKVPFQPNGMKAASNAPSTWHSFAECIAAVESGAMDGVGLAIQGIEDQLIFLDLDKCRNPETGELTPWARKVVDEAASYTEITPSQRGVRIIGRGGVEKRGRSGFSNVEDDTSAALEVYTPKDVRYLTVTGAMLPGTWPLLSDISEITQRLIDNKGRLEPKPTMLALSAPSSLPKPVQAPAPEYTPKADGILAKVSRFVSKDEIELDKIIKLGAAPGQRSEHFHHATGLAKRLGWAPEQLEAQMREHPQGIASKYLAPHDRLAAEIARCWGKVEGQPTVLGFDVARGVSGVNGVNGASEKADRFQWLTHTRAEEPVLQGNWLVKKMIPARGLAVLYGRPGSGKTFSCIDIALHIAAGLPWRGVKVRQSGVSYVSPEAGRAGVNRIIGWTKHTLNPWPKAFRLSPVQINLCSSGDDATALVEDIRQNQPDCGLVVIDTLNRAMAGGDENSGEDMGLFVAICDHIAKELNCLVLVVHHSGKDTAKGSRGHSSLLGAVDLELEVTKEQGQPGVIRVTKLRDGEDGGEYGFDLTRVVLGVDEDGEAVTTAVAVEVATEEKEPLIKTVRPLGRAQDAVASAFNQYVDDYGRFTPSGTGFPEVGTTMAVDLDAFIEFAAGKMTGAKPHEKRKNARQAVDGLLERKYFCLNRGLLWRLK